MKKLTLFLLGSTLLFSTVACDVSRTSSDAPTSTDDTAKVEDATEVKTTKEDGVSEVRRKQLNSDIRAREERNNVAGDDQEKLDSDLESQVRSKLEANIPRSKLTIESEEGTVKVLGTVPSQDEYNKIMPLAKEIKGVKDVNVEVEIVPATES
ncbi:transport-associated protein [Chondrocystis sp. NIES-4102]|nr:transport-associated protein [Chondrocystis sp. NIES-4102]